MATIAMDSQSDVKVKAEPKPALTPPASEEADKQDDSGSELSDLELEPEDISEIEPDHYYDGGKIPVFKPTMDQFRSFKSFIARIDKYGMKSGIVKVIPPKEWRDALPALDEQVKTVKVKNPITQEFHGTHGTYTQANIEKQRSYNLPQWKALSEESNHQPPAKRGERRRNQISSIRTAPSRSKKDAAPVPEKNGKKRGPGRPRVRPLPTTVHKIEDNGEARSRDEAPPTPLSPVSKSIRIGSEQPSDDEDTSAGKVKGRQPKSVSSRRQHNRRDQVDVIDEEAFKDFDYRVYNQNEWTPERCNELETAYWKSLTFNNPMYGADMPGSLFDDSTESWNVAKLENLLDVLGQKVPGVNTAYLYLGMWKASFAWHLEDVDLYSINYIHFGAPKQWYSISQEDARRFEAAMRSVWPNDSKNCDQFLRHKTYLISPQLLQSQYNIRVNRLVHHEGEFVITFPYGYHSGYNLGYNCAESVNFATESWLDYGRVAKKCNCEADSVWVDVHDIERKLRGEPTPEYYEETEEEDDEDDEDEEGPTDLPTPPGSDKGKARPRARKRKREASDKDGKPKVKKLRIKIKAPAYEPCILCPNDNKHEKLLPTDNGKQAHLRCGLYTPETYIAEKSGSETICDVECIDKARLELKCNFCRSKRGAVFQCSQKKCTRAYHATCAAPAGVQVDIGLVPVYGKDGTEYTDTGIDFRCRFHRIKRNKNMDAASLEDSNLIRKYSHKLAVRELVQMQYYQGDIFAGVVLENRKSEHTLLVEILPTGDKLEVEYKWVLAWDRANSQLPIPSENAIPLPAELASKSRTTAEDPSIDKPPIDQPFCDGFVLAEFNTCHPIRNPAQVKVDLSKSKTLWLYLGKTSTDCKAQYTGDFARQVHDTAANFLDSVRATYTPVSMVPPRRSLPAAYPAGANIHALNAAGAGAQYRQQMQPKPLPKPLPKPSYERPSFNAPAGYQSAKERPYQGKYAITDPAQPHRKGGYNVDPQALYNQRAFTQNAAAQSVPRPISTRGLYRAPQAQMSPVAPMAPMMAGSTQRPPPANPLSRDHHWNSSSYRPPEQPQQPQRTWQPQPTQYSRPNRPIHQAPVARMTGGALTSSQLPASPSTPQKKTTKPHKAPLIPIRTGERPPDPVLEKYPYLRGADKLRPATYQSPYLKGGGFSPAYLPSPEAPPVPSGTSISEDYLVTRSTSEQQKIMAFKRRTSDILAQRQRDEIRRQQEKLRDQKWQSQKYQAPPVHSFAPSPYSSSAQHNSQAHRPSQQYSAPLQSSHAYNHDFSPQPFIHAHSYLHNSPPMQQSHPVSGLQYQSPQDFQLQMQRESQRDGTGASFEHFFKGLQNAAASGHERAGSYGGGGGGQGSPLKTEMGNGGEMLPMMRDSRF